MHGVVARFQRAGGLALSNRRKEGMGMPLKTRAHILIHDEEGWNAFSRSANVNLGGGRGGGQQHPHRRVSKSYARIFCSMRIDTFILGDMQAKVTYY